MASPTIEVAHRRAGTITALRPHSLVLVRRNDSSALISSRSRSARSQKSAPTSSAGAVPAYTAARGCSMPRSTRS